MIYRGKKKTIKARMNHSIQALQENTGEFNVKKLIFFPFNPLD